MVQVGVGADDVGGGFFGGFDEFYIAEAGKFEGVKTMLHHSKHFTRASNFKINFG